MEGIKYRDNNPLYDKLICDSMLWAKYIRCRTLSCASNKLTYMNTKAITFQMMTNIDFMLKSVHGRDRMVVGFTTTYVMSVYLH